MSRAAKSVFFFGIYALLLGATLVVAPNVLMKIFSVPETTEVWIRVVGMLILLLGYLYVRTGTDKKDMTNFFRLTIHTRTSVIVFLTIFVLLNYVEPIIIFFGVIDLAGALWTTLALRSAVN